MSEPIFRSPIAAHISLSVRSIDKSTQFYAQLFGREPSKVRPGYAKCQLESPPLNLSLLESTAAVAAPGAHFGIQLADTSDVMRSTRRLDELGLTSMKEEKTVCCYSEQDKVWATDPDGNRWELFAALRKASDEEETQARAERAEEGQACCAPECCSLRMIPRWALL